MKQGTKASFREGQLSSRGKLIVAELAVKEYGTQSCRVGANEQENGKVGSQNPQAPVQNRYAVQLFTHLITGAKPHTAHQLDLPRAPYSLAAPSFTAPSTNWFALVAIVSGDDLAAERPLFQLTTLGFASELKKTASGALTFFGLPKISLLPVSVAEQWALCFLLAKTC
ncbi:hypothetical protein TSUD_302150 [Trifolium subterraneum]|uniref:Uncharacterized protein n=1 Tax=Trifolium subterraneum TaxID=3900 RepID=A0A2Z6PNL8_TRISU|nr:hypothetical protein TSUD_302150 [Trifolium subterraneum]